MNIYKIIEELEEKVVAKMQPIVKNFKDNQELTHLELSNMFSNFQWNHRRSLVWEILYDIVSEQGIDLNNLKTEEDKQNASVIYQIIPEKIEKIIDSIYYKEIRLIVFNGKDRNFF